MFFSGLPQASVPIAAILHIIYYVSSFVSSRDSELLFIFAFPVSSIMPGIKHALNRHLLKGMLDF